MSKQWGFRDTDRRSDDNRRGGRVKGPRLFGRVNRDIPDSEIDAMVKKGLTEAQIMRKLGEVSPAEKGKVSRRVSGKITKRNQGGKK